ncbi:MAG: OadG family protein [Prevotella sp.]|nr:OadG family protein [Prevotella sp.]
MENIGLGITLMVIGMVTVFAILLIVIYLSRLLIALINRIAPDETRPARRQPEAEAVSPVTMSVIAAAVNRLTGGKGMVRSVERL